MKKRLVLLMALSLTFAFPAAVMAEDTTAAEETADDTEAADSTAEDADVKDKIVTLSTCTNHGRQRFLIQGVLTNIENNNE